MKSAKTIRPSSVLLEVHNEGLAVFVYDEAHAEAIRNSGMDLLAGSGGDDDLDDPALLGLAGQGLLFVYELFEDRRLRVEVSLGPPLN